MDATRNARAYSQTVFELSGQPYAPDDPELHTACSQTASSSLPWGERGRLASKPASVPLPLSAEDSFPGRWTRQSRSTNRFGIAGIAQ